MAEKVEQKPRSPWIKGPNLTIPVPEFSIEDFKKHSHMLTSPTPSSDAAKPKWKNCLCSPTTHVGSFRCRHHRNSSVGGGLHRAGGSVGSNLSELTRKNPVPLMTLSKLDTIPS